MPSEIRDIVLHFGLRRGTQLPKEGKLHINVAVEYQLLLPSSPTKDSTAVNEQLLSDLPPCTASHDIRLPIIPTEKVRTDLSGGLPPDYLRPGDRVQYQAQVQGAGPQRADAPDTWIVSRVTRVATEATDHFEAGWVQLDEGGPNGRRGAWVNPADGSKLRALPRGAAQTCCENPKVMVQRCRMQSSAVLQQILHLCDQDVWDDARNGLVVLQSEFRKFMDRRLDRSCGSTTSGTGCASGGGGPSGGSGGAVVVLDERTGAPLPFLPAVERGMIKSLQTDANRMLAGLRGESEHPGSWRLRRSPVRHDLLMLFAAYRTQHVAPHVGAHTGIVQPSSTQVALSERAVEFMRQATSNRPNEPRGASFIKALSPPGLVVSSPTLAWRSGLGPLSFGCGPGKFEFRPQKRFPIPSQAEYYHKKGAGAEAASREDGAWMNKQGNKGRNVGSSSGTSSAGTSAKGRGAASAESSSAATTPSVAETLGWEPSWALGFHYSGGSQQPASKGDGKSFAAHRGGKFLEPREPFGKGKSFGKSPAGKSPLGKPPSGKSLKKSGKGSKGVADETDRSVHHPEQWRQWEPSASSFNGLRPPAPTTDPAAASATSPVDSAPALSSSPTTLSSSTTTTPQPFQPAQSWGTRGPSQQSPTGAGGISSFLTVVQLPPSPTSFLNPQQQHEQGRNFFGGAGAKGKGAGVRQPGLTSWTFPSRKTSTNPPAPSSASAAVRPPSSADGQLLKPTYSTGPNSEENWARHLLEKGAGKQ